MKIIPPRAAMVVVAVVSVVTLLFLRSAFVCPSYGDALAHLIFWKRRTPDSGTRFQWIMSGSGKGPKGSDYDTSLYRSSDCVAVDSYSYTFSSSSDANEDMKRRLATFHHIYEHAADNSSPDGRIVEWAIALSDPGGEYLIIERRDKVVRVTTSKSLPHALEFHRRSRASDDRR
jgi:hypothetical protein